MGITSSQTQVEGITLKPVPKAMKGLGRNNICAASITKFCSGNFWREPSERSGKLT
jgi:hypothetical protein